MQRYTRTTSRTVAWIKATNDGECLVLAPPYQRNPVWSDKQKSALIETILLEYPIPELYMQEIITSDGKEEHIVVDGQQRTRAVLEYISGKFEIQEENSLWVGMMFDDLTSSDKKKIFEYDFVVRILPELPPEQIRSIFQRINKNNMSLNPQELRHATYWGAFIKLMESISDYEFWNVANIFSANDRRRMLDIEFISELSVAILNGPQNKKTNLDKYYAAYEEEFLEDEMIRSTFFSTLGEINQACPDLSSTRWRKKSDFYTLFLLIAEYSACLPLSQENRGELRNRLMKFAKGVDSELAIFKQSRPGENITQVSFGYPPLSPEIDYARAVERAASDLASRRARRAALDAVIGSLFTPKNSVDHSAAPPASIIERDDAEEPADLEQDESE